MSTPSYPGALDTLGSSIMPTAATLDARNLGAATPGVNEHSDLHDTLAQAIIALETLAGITGATDAASLLGQIATGWTACSVSTWTCNSVNVAASGTSCGSYNIFCSTNLTGIIGIGDRIRLVHSGTTKYFIVANVSWNAGSNGLFVVTLLSPNQLDFSQADLTATTVTSVCYSHAKNPAGFPTVASRDWVCLLFSTTSRTQASPVSGTWYNAESLVVPVGAWKISAQFMLEAISNGSTINASATGGLATSSNTAPIAGLQAFTFAQSAATNSVVISPSFVQTWISLTSALTYYLNYAEGITGQATAGIRGDSSGTFIVAECGLL